MFPDQFEVQAIQSVIDCCTGMLVGIRLMTSERNTAFLLCVIMWVEWGWVGEEGSKVLTFLSHIVLRSLILNQSLPCPNNISVQVLWKFRHPFRKYGADKPFPNPNILKPHVTLKIQSKSPKSNHFFPTFQQYISASLVEIQPSLQEIWCRQAIYQHSKTLCDLEKGVKVTKIKSDLVHVVCICASLVKMHLFLLDIGYRQAIFQHPKTLCDLENRVITKIHQFLSMYQQYIRSVQV